MVRAAERKAELLAEADEREVAAVDHMVAGEAAGDVAALLQAV